MSFSPVVLFVYNRLWHTRKTVEFLLKNDGADQTDLIIYSDGSKNQLDNRNVQQVREYIKSIKGFKSVVVKYQKENIGLAASIIEGVTKVVNEFGRVIVLEDDIITAPNFLKYMNSALDYYKASNEVMHISAYNYPLNLAQNDDVFFMKPTSCWGWGTWKTSWQAFEKNSSKLLRKFTSGMIKEFNLNNSYDYWCQVKLNHEGVQNTWAVFWYASVYLKNGLSLHPAITLTQNIGFDGSGENCALESFFEGQISTSYTWNFREPSTKDEYYEGLVRKFFRSSYKGGYFKSLVNRLKKCVPNNFKTQLKNIIISLRNNPAQLASEHKFLYKQPRYVPGKVYLNGRPLKYPDSASFISMYKEIFVGQSYRFKTTTKNPRILDLGANIGLSILYFKEIFPSARISAFEADPKIFTYLEYNTQDLQGVQLIPKAVYGYETELSFSSDSSDGGSLFQQNGEVIEVQTCVLSSYLNEPIDFLKIDVEGAELEILKECKELLNNVENLFVEYHSFQGTQQGLHQLLTIISEAGFRYYISDVPLTSKNPYLGVNVVNNMDLQLNISCVRY